MVDQGIELYLNEVKIHVNEYKQELDELAANSLTNSRDYRAAERLLQLLTEVSIGLAKHWLKSLAIESGSSAYQTFVGLNKLNLLSDQELQEWRKIIGLRNSLVHDYLTVDREIVLNILSEKKYQALLQFCAKAQAALVSV